MFDKNERVTICEASVEDVIALLKRYPDDTKVCFCGSSQGYLHVARAGKLISFDFNRLDDDYPDETTSKEN